MQSRYILLFDPSDMVEKPEYADICHQLSNVIILCDTSGIQIFFTQ